MAKLFIVAAASGAGKSTIVNRLLQQSTNYVLERIVTYTTRLPRMGEANGVDYHFISVPEFEAKIQEGFFAEWSTVYGHYYGSPKNFVQKLNQGISQIAIVDHKGAKNLLTQVPEAVAIWIDVPQRAVLEQRLQERGQSSAQDIQHRLSIAEQEYLRVEHEPIYLYTIINDNISDSAEALDAIIKKELNCL
jgi:guanylate kinase